MTALQFVYH